MQALDIQVVIITFTSLFLLILVSTETPDTLEYLEDRKIISAGPSNVSVTGVLSRKSFTNGLPGPSNGIYLHPLACLQRV